VLREDQLLTFTITSVRMPNPYPLNHVVGRFTDLLFLAIGFFIFIFFFWPADKQAQVLGLMLGIFTALNMGKPLAWQLWAGELAFIAQFFVLFFLPLSCPLFLIFPEASPLVGRWPYLGRWIYLPFWSSYSQTSESLGFYDHLSRCWRSVFLICCPVGTNC
jgi:hypothetical protein